LAKLSRNTVKVIPVIKAKWRVWREQKKRRMLGHENGTNDWGKSEVRCRNTGSAKFEREGKRKKGGKERRRYESKLNSRSDSRRLNWSSNGEVSSELKERERQ
jgi:hypothetical protein